VVALVYCACVPPASTKAPSIKWPRPEVSKHPRYSQHCLLNDRAFLRRAMGIRTSDCSSPAGTSGTCLAFSPGLVGGHSSASTRTTYHQGPRSSLSTQVILAAPEHNNVPVLAHKCCPDADPSSMSLLRKARSASSATFKETCRPRTRRSLHHRADVRNTAIDARSTTRSAISREAHYEGQRSISRRCEKRPGLDAPILAGRAD